MQCRSNSFVDAPTIPIPEPLIYGSFLMAGHRFQWLQGPLILGLLASSLVDEIDPGGCLFLVLESQCSHLQQMTRDSWGIEHVSLRFLQMSSRWRHIGSMSFGCATNAENCPMHKSETKTIQMRPQIGEAQVMYYPTVIHLTIFSLMRTGGCRPEARS